ncbi:MAG: hypothetical protein LUF27_02455 [Lachnospiraceae bacterium]|nr:hypothetical protein [Lachnospiraceae bacterium]
MKLKDQIIRRIDRLMYRTWNEDQPARTWHSGFYHRYFEGYRENTTADQDGKHKKVERFYAGCYYLDQEKTADYIGKRVLYAILLAGAVYLYYVSCFTEQLAANYATAVSVLQSVDIFLFLWLAYIYVCGLLAGRKMIYSEYKGSHIRMTQVTLAGSVSLAATAAAKLIYAVYERALDVLHIQNAAILVAAAGFLWMIRLVEMRTKYEVEESKQAGKAGIEIS